MILTLEVTGPQGADAAAVVRKVFGEAGGTIGRLPDNHLVLPDPYVSNRHARIHYANGTFLIEDTSTNGVFLNSMDNRLVRGQAHPIESGDQIFIDPYELRVSVVADARPKAPPSFSDPFAAAAPPAPYASPLEPFGASADDVDPLSLLGFEAPKTPSTPAPRAADMPWGSVLNEPYTPPAPLPAVAPASPVAFIPDDYDPLCADESHVAAAAVAAAPPASSTPVPAVTPPSRPPAPPAAPSAPVAVPGRRGAPASNGDESLKALLAAAGVADAAVPAEFAGTFGRILRTVVSGVMDVLQARQRVKDEFRIRVTMFKKSDNNPLKFSANAEDALHNLLVKRNPAYLTPVDAFEDAFEDVRHHEIAMLTGMRAAFEAMLAEFDPDRLQQLFDKQMKKGALVSAPAKFRYWDLYRDKVHDLTVDPDGSFRRLFGDAFAKAYEEQMERLKSTSRGESR